MSRLVILALCAFPLQVISNTLVSKIEISFVIPFQLVGGQFQGRSKEWAQKIRLQI